MRSVSHNTLVIPGFKPNDLCTARGIAIARKQLGVCGVGIFHVKTIPGLAHQAGRGGDAQDALGDAESQ